MRIDPKILKAVINALIMVVIFSVLFFSALPHVGYGLTRGKLIQTLSNARQIHLAIITAALDAQTTGTPSPWPGNLPISTTKDYVAFLVTNNFVKEGDIKIFSGPGFPTAQSLKEFSERNCVFTIYRVSEKDPADTILLSSKNVDLVTGRVESNILDFKKEFVIFHKGGDGNVYKAVDGLTNVLGRMPPRLPTALAP